MRTQAFLFSLIMGLTMTRGESQQHIVKISSVEDMIAFSKAVNSGESYLGTTVELDTDIDFNGAQLEPIGTGIPDKDGIMTWAPFEGTFDGKEHLIKNVSIITASKSYIGLFGYARGATIRNTAISTDLAAKFGKESTDIVVPKYVGSLVGLCEATSDRKCVVENCFSRGTLLAESQAGEVYVGGIVGSCDKGECDIRNIVQAIGTTIGGRMEGGLVYLGGIIGNCVNDCHISNAISYGVLINGCSNMRDAYVGGIIGYAGEHTTVENCIIYSFVLSFFANSHAGTIAGASVGKSKADPNAFAHCYWDDTHGDFYTAISAINTSESTSTTDLISYKHSSLEKDLFVNLKERNDDGQFKWACILFDTRRSGVKRVPQMIMPLGYWTSFFLLERPKCAKCPPFEEWYFDEELKTKYTPENLAEGVTTLYAKWSDEHIASFFDADGTPLSRIIIKEGQPFALPEGIRALKDYERWTTSVPVEEKDNHEFVGPSSDVTYTLTVANEVPVVFYSNGAKYLATSQEIGAKIAFPEVKPTMKGHSFEEWKIRDGNELAFVPDYKIEYDAVWTTNSYKITFIVGKDDIFASNVQEFGTDIIVPKIAPKKDGLKFNGWAGNIERGVKTVPDHDVVFHATWAFTKETIRTFVLSIVAIIVAGYVLKTFTKFAIAGSKKETKETKDQKQTPQKRKTRNN